MKDKIKRQSAQNIALQDIAFRLTFYIHQPELLSPDNLLLAIFKFVVENKPEIDNKEVKNDWDCLACKACPWDYAKFCKIVNSRI